MWVFWAAYIIATSWFLIANGLWAANMMPPTETWLLVVCSILYVLIVTETVYLLIGANWSKLSSENRKFSEPEQTSRDNKRHHYYSLFRRRALKQGFNNKKQNSEAANNLAESEQSNTRGTLVATAIIAGVGLLSFGISAGTLVVLYNQQIAMQGQLAAMEIDQRPWMRLAKDAPITIEKLEVQKDQILVWISFNVENVGKSPAQRINVLPSLLIPDIEPWSFKEVKRVCADAKRPNLTVGNVVFPDDKEAIGPINFGRPMSEIKKATYRRAEDQYAGWAQGFGKDEADKVHGFLLKTADFTTLTVVGCINYMFGEDGTVHQTAFIYDLSRSTPEVRNGATNSSAIDITEIGVVDGKDLVLKPTMLGTFAD